MKYKGIVKTGFGEGSLWIKKAKEVFKKKYDLDVFLGTLNVKLTDKIYLNESDKIMPEEYGGSLVVLVQKCKINGHIGYIVRTEKNNTENGDHPLDIIEVVSDVCFRDIYNLKDNDEVQVILD